MFITNEAHRSKFSALFGETKQAHWAAVELALNHPWFLVNFKQFEDDPIADSEDNFSISRTMLVDCISSVEQLIQSNSSELFKFESVQIVTPGHMNGTCEWKMETLDLVRTAHHPDYDGHSVDMYVTTEGHKYTHCMLGLPVDELSLGETWFQAPCPMVAQS